MFGTTFSTPPSAYNLPSCYLSSLPTQMRDMGCHEDEEDDDNNNNNDDNDGDDDDDDNGDNHVLQQ